MVYCGKASLGCQSCRTRRIKCDKLKPECSQCVRVNKKCPGYRDQLSLMFRDESSKVMQKAHAQWGMNETLGTSSPATFVQYNPSRSQSVSSPISPEQPSKLAEKGKSKSPPDESNATTARRSSAPGSSTARRRGAAVRAVKPDPDELALQMIPTLEPTIEERGIQFYFQRYLIGHPDEIQNHGELTATANRWIWHPELQDSIAAIGLAALANLSADFEMMNIARQKYSTALNRAGQLIFQRKENMDLYVSMRSVVMLALFETVKGPHQSNGQAASAHIMGGAAMMRSWLPNQSQPQMRWGGFRALIQLLYSMFITSHTKGESLPPNVINWIAFSNKAASPDDRPSTTLAGHIAKYLALSSTTIKQVLSDGRPKTAVIIREVLSVDDDLDGWEQGLGKTWRFRTVEAPALPARAIFRGRYHVYHDMWAARMLNFYRWARILTNQLLVNLVDRFPESSLPLVSAARRERALEVAGRLAEDMLTSAPTHWRHPLMEDVEPIAVENAGGGAYGGAGLPLLLSHLRVAACAPGLPVENWEWAMGLVHCIWCDTGMLHARSMLDAMSLHHERLQKIEPEGILLHDE